MKLILLTLLFDSATGCAMCQVVEMSRDDYDKFLQDTKDLKALRYGYAFLNQENKELRLQYKIDTDSLQGKIDLLEGTVIDWETKYEKLKESSSEAIEKAYKMAEGYKQLAVEKSRDIARLKKLMSGCCE